MASEVKTTQHFKGEGVDGEEASCVLSLGAWHGCKALREELSTLALQLDILNSGLFK